MPTITIYFIRSGMIFFALSMLTGVEMAASQSGLISAPVVMVRPLFWHFLLVGWITQIIMGVSIWMYPRRRKAGSSQRGSENTARLAFTGINFGLVLRAATEPMAFGAAYSESRLIAWGLVLSALLQLGGGLAYVIAIWPRVKGKRKRSAKRGKK
ncbi:MAG: hypothetical protein R3281_03690 [Balneolaceae bacterium]|nr:hypothetical protein [Balneolaceae bacterium]